MSQIQGLRDPDASLQTVFASNCQGDNLDSFCLPRKDMTRLQKWLDKAMRHSSFQATKRPEDKLEEVYRMFLSVDYKFGGLNRN